LGAVANRQGLDPAGDDAITYDVGPDDHQLTAGADRTATLREMLELSPAARSRWAIR
jgi:hypothetical protein